MGRRMGENIGLDLIDKVKFVDVQELPIDQKIRAIHTMLDQYITYLLEDQKIHFTTLFTKISYLSLQRKLSHSLTHSLHLHRKLYSDEVQTIESYRIARFALVQLIVEIEELRVDENLSYLLEHEKVSREKEKQGSFLSFARVHVFQQDIKGDQLSAFHEDRPEEQIVIQFDVKGKNQEFNSIFRFLQRTAKYPITLHLENITINAEGRWEPEKIIFEPDYLVDVTTVSECFKPGEFSPLFYFIKKFIPVFQNKYLIVGNIANYFLDELFNDPSSTFDNLIRKTFGISPLGFSMMDDGELKEVVHTLKTHFYSIREVVQDHFQQHGITNENTSLEPSFYSPKYGFQGRLDLYAKSIDQKEAKIVELKSGKPYRANTYGLNINHYVQTLLYDLLVSSVEGSKLKTSCFILYSSQTKNALRFAPPLRAQQRQAIALRNQLVEIDYLLANVDIENQKIFSYIQSTAIKSDGFARRDIERFEKIYQQANTLSRKYFNAFTAFIAREQILSKTGEYGLDKSSGLAGLWLDDMQEKIENFQVLNALIINDIKIEKEHTVLVLERTKETAENANFRKGDLGVLYPFTHGNRSVLKNQIYKCSITRIEHDVVEVRLRNKQQNTSIFQSAVTWHIEHDHLDHGFNAMYQDCFLFLSQQQDYQYKLLGKLPPDRGEALKSAEIGSYVTSEQRDILHQMIGAKDYYLLWGPPGTGKTSVVLFEYLKHIFLNTKEKVLVVAYTNRAVDEICESIERIGHEIKDQYFRIGSRYSTDTRFTDDLLVTKLESINNRYDLLSLLQNSRIIVSTLASIHGKKELFSMVNIDTIVVDEASQILEPQLIGFLSYAPKFILIGDHYQLPAIVRQREDESAVHDTDLKEIGLIERRNSLFERLYRRSQKMKWTWAFGKLTHQGRMHVDIMAFVNKHFYHNQLSIVPDRTDLENRKMDELLFGSRMIYIPTNIDKSSINYKTNIYEARWTAEILKRYEKLFSSSQQLSIGVITPYRAQISAIHGEIRRLKIDLDITVDTVERYQGGARDIIILSLCLNAKSQLNQLVNLSVEGIDRKLNVAITRARKQVIVLGNESIMKMNDVYTSLISDCIRMEITREFGDFAGNGEE